jgi:hypothetical protein
MGHQLADGRGVVLSPLACQVPAIRIARVYAGSIVATYVCAQRSHRVLCTLLCRDELRLSNFTQILGILRLQHRDTMSRGTGVIIPGVAHATTATVCCSSPKGGTGVFIPGYAPIQPTGSTSPRGGTGVFTPRVRHERDSIDAPRANSTSPTTHPNTRAGKLRSSRAPAVMHGHRREAAEANDVARTAADQAISPHYYSPAANPELHRRAYSSTNRSPRCSLHVAPPPPPPRRHSYEQYSSSYGAMYNGTMVHAGQGCFMGWVWVPTDHGTGAALSSCSST